MKLDKVRHAKKNGIPVRAATTRQSNTNIQTHEEYSNALYEHPLIVARPFVVFCKANAIINIFAEHTREQQYWRFNDTAAHAAVAKIDVCGKYEQCA